MHLQVGDRRDAVGENHCSSECPDIKHHPASDVERASPAG